MTITPSIIPTEALTRWRLEHPERYPFVLSDSSPLTERSSFDPSCIRNRKAWLIDHTFYVSSRGEGTRPLQSPSPREFHEMQWNSDYGSKGRLIQERKIPVVSSDHATDSSPPGTDDTTSTVWSRKYRHPFPGITILSRLVKGLGWTKMEPEADQSHRSWLEEAGSLFRDRRLDLEPISVPPPDDCDIPNAIFARKYQLIDTGATLTPDLHISQMPTAEAKATDIIVEAANTGLLDNPSRWSFKGPFTPELGFDGGLDYRWSLREPAIIIRRFDVDGPHEEDELPPSSLYRENCIERSESMSIHWRSSTKRQGIVFGIDDISNWIGDNPRQELLPKSPEFDLNERLDTPFCRLESKRTKIHAEESLDHPPSQISEGLTPHTINKQEQSVIDR